MGASHYVKAIMNFRWSCLLVLALSALACGRGPSTTTVAGLAAARVGEEPVPKVHLYENHSSALIAWRRAGVEDRILVHMDGHFDFDWLPDETVARIAAAHPDELGNLELHPYTLDDQTHRRFAIWNFLYPAARLGIVRRLIWVVPDGTLPDAATVGKLGRQAILRKIQMISLREAASLVSDGRTLEGEVLGLPVTICELADLPELDEAVLLDVDLDYFTTRSALTQQVSRRPWTTPEEVLEGLRRRGMRTDLVTLSLSTIGGYVPTTARWLGRVMKEHLKNPSLPFDSVDLRLEAERAERAEETEKATRLYENLVAMTPDDANAWLSLCHVLKESRRDGKRSTAACERALALDPLLEHEELFEGDRLWINRDFDEALVRIKGYIERSPSSPFLPYALRREADCMWRLGRLDEAEATFRRVLELAPDHADTHLDLGELLRQRGRLGEAIEELETARTILPERAGYAMSLGTTYLLADRLEDAAAHLWEAVKRQPCHAEAQGNLAVVLIRLGRQDEAAIHITTGLAIQPRHAGLKKMASELDRLGVGVTRVKGFPQN